MRTRFALKPRGVLKENSSLNGGDVHTRAIIAMALREGTLEVRYSARWISDEPNILKAWGSRPAINTDVKPKFVTAKRALWWKSVCWSDDIQDWDFNRARMVVTLSRDPLRRIMLSGIRFNSEHIKKALAPGSLSLEAGAFDKGRYTNSWRRFWHDIIILAAGSKQAVKDSPLGGFSTGNELMREIFRSLYRDDEIAAESTTDEELAKALADRQPFNLQEGAVIKEIKYLRSALNLKERGMKAKKSD